MLRKLPELLGLGCYLVQDDRTRRKLDPTNHYRFEDGTPAKLDGTMGQYMWCWNIGFYFAEWKVGNLKYYAVSLSPIKGKQCVYIPAGGLSALGGGVMDRTNNILCSVVSDAAQYRGGNNDASRDGTYRTQLGMVATNMQYRNFSTYARKRGEGWDANWYVAQAVVEILFMIIFGTRNMQETVIAEKDSNGLYQGGLGSGTTNMPNWDQWGYYPVVPTSAGIELGDGCGEATFNVLKEDGSLHYAAKVPVFFGLKHPFGHIWKIVRGLVDNVGEEKSEVYVAPSFMPVMMTIRFPALSRFARFREPPVISSRKVTTCFAPCRPKSERPPRLISVTIFGRIQHHPKGFVSASPVLTLTMARMRGRCYVYEPCSLVFGCGCVRSPLLL